MAPAPETVAVTFDIKKPREDTEDKEAQAEIENGEKNQSTGSEKRCACHSVILSY